jgi:hypothetical protein
MRTKAKIYSILLLPLATLGLFLLISARQAEQAKEAYHHESKKQTAANPLRDAYFGDLHLHTNYSLDAFVIYGTRTTPDQAYRFAKGEKVDFIGNEIQKKVPLDFLAVTDHSETFGVINAIDDTSSALYKSDLGKKIREEGVNTFWSSTAIQAITSGKRVPGHEEKNIRSVWNKEVDAANKHNSPGKFTTFIGYEWTSFPDYQNLHRNVIFGGGKAPGQPFSASDSYKPEDLWSFLENQRKQGIDAIIIPHNSNVSNGLMFDWKDSEGKPISKAYAQRRQDNEPLTEVSQNKGTSETHPSLSSNDEFAGFELYENLLATTRKGKVEGSYVRDAYGRGLIIQQQTGVNPYKFGLIGATDFHNGISASEESSFIGAGGGGIDTSFRWPTLSDGLSKKAVNGSGALTGVWAEENTREAIFNAFKKKEVFATSGTRLRFRFFGGWNFDKKILQSTDWIKQAYAAGVSMGGDLPKKLTNAKAPTFVLWAVKDPNSANLDRAQIVKVWVKGTKQFEKVFDVALSDKRAINHVNGKAPAVGNTVDEKKGTYTNSIGDTELQAVWTDPEFDQHVASVYYLRVLEIPTPRWSTIVSARSGQPLPEGTAVSVQERGWSSPIWYTPSK